MRATPRSRSSARFLIASVVALLPLGLLIGVTGGPAMAAAAFQAKGSVEQVYVTGLTPGATVTLHNSDGSQIASREASSLGGSLFREVPADSGYTVRSGGEESDPITVLPNQSAPPSNDIYNQTLPRSGYGYMTMRDGTKLAYAVHPPTQPANLGLPGLPLTELDVPGNVPYTAPYPTLVEYSGYGYANPSGPDSGIAVLANLMGFAVVDVNMRGTGCSGGAFDFFEPLQSLDGYDIIETVARQKWVRGGKVGMLGISYGGISQLFVGQTRPPSLAALTPVSLIDTVATTLYPGGIRNDGFAVEWAKQRQAEAQPAGTGAEGTQEYAEQKIADGDAVCKDNQVLHPEAADLLEKIEANDHYRPEIADPLDPVTFVNKINVPVFLACQWQDEQTGGHCPTLAKRMTGTSKKWFTFTNGAHIDSLDPATLNRLYDFLMLYVAKEAPLAKSALLRAAAPVFYSTALGTAQTDVITLPLDPIQLKPTYASALTAFEALKPVRVLFGNGAGADPLGQKVAGNPYPSYEKSFDAFPVPTQQAKSWYLGPDQTLRDTAAPTRGINAFEADPSALPLNNFTAGTGSGGLWGNAKNWAWDWRTHPAGKSLSYVTAPLSQDTTVVGAGAVELWARSSEPDVDLMVTVSEIDAKGNETFVQNGFMRGSMRKLDKTDDGMFKEPSTLLEPHPSLRPDDDEPMPSTDFTKVTVPLYFSGHPYRAGTRIRIVVSAPNGTQPIWNFRHTKPELGGDSTTVEVTFAENKQSRLVLPVIPGQSIPAAQPPCGSLRNQPCRPFVATVNQVSPN
ncbi:MAG TPA: CocE/NonD family hydrolase [Aeromicrobium sp.]|nr:CocE/NonD family hydrolase [Aeromicrobium sp.]